MYYCGWDGGGTKTTVCILDQNGEHIAEASFGPLNANGAAIGHVEQTVNDALAFMARQPGGLSACGGLVIGMAGISNRSFREHMEQMVRSHHYMGHLHITGDQVIALNGAISGPGAILIAGTGSICYGRDADGEPFRVGGYGYLIDDLGSGYAIGRSILNAVVCASDHRAEPTALTKLLYDSLGIASIGSLISWLYAGTTGKKESAGRAPLLLEGLALEDAASERIAEESADALAQLVLTGFHSHGISTGELALNGSIFSYFPTIRERVTKIIEENLPDVRIIEPRKSPAEGAARFAYHAFSPAPAAEG